MEDGRFSPRLVTALQPSLLAARLLVVVAAVLVILALHAATPAGAAEGISAHPAAVSAAGLACVDTVGASSGGDSDGCCCPTVCETMSAACEIRLGVDEFRVSGVAAVMTLRSVDEPLPAPWRVSTHRSPGRPIGLAIAALAVSRI